MPIELIALPPELVTIDESRYPDRDDRWILDHLTYCLSLIDSLPAIGIVIDAKGPVVIWRHKYLRIALALRRPLIRAVIESGSDEEAKASILGRSDVQTLDWNEIDAIERATPVVDQWHVFYFERALTAFEKSLFDKGAAPWEGRVCELFGLLR